VTIIVNVEFIFRAIHVNHARLSSYGDSWTITLRSYLLLVDRYRRFVDAIAACPRDLYSVKGRLPFCKGDTCG